MSPYNLPEEAVFSVEVRRGKFHHFTFREALTVLAVHGKSLSALDEAELFHKLCNRTNHNYRIEILKEVKQLRVKRLAVAVEILDQAQAILKFYPDS